MNNSCENLLLTSLTQYYNDNPGKKEILKKIVEGKHRLSLRVIDWLVTHYSKTSNVFYWILQKNEDIYMEYPIHLQEQDCCKKVKKVSLYLDYRAQLKSYAKINFDSFRRHNRISFMLDKEDDEAIETTIGQLNFFRWAFNNNVLQYAMDNYDKIYQHMINNNSYNKQKQVKQANNNIQDITKTMCTLRFD